MNVGTVLAGGAIGSFVGTRFSAGLRRTLMQAVGLTTLVIGLQRVLPAENVLLILASVALGGAVGEILRIESGLARIGELAQQAVERWGPQHAPLAQREGRFSPVASGEARAAERGPAGGGRDIQGAAAPVAQGFVTASLIFCVGPMTILGSFEDGLTGAYQTLALKATLDGITAALLASTLGWGVLLASGTVLVYQGALTLGASLLRGLLTEPMIAQMTAAGGLLILGIGFNILELTRIRVGNLLPALVIAPALVAFSGPRGG